MTNPDPVRARAARSPFSTPMRIGAAVATVVAALLLTAILLPGGPFGPAASPGQSASALASASPSESMPNPTTQPTATPVPTPTPASAWTGLDWSDGVAPFAPNTSFINDLVWWRGGYVGVGGTEQQCQGDGTVFASANGLDWEIVYQAELPADWYFEHLAPLGDGLLAITNARPGPIDCPVEALPSHAPDLPPAPQLWYSEDGTNWSEIDSPSWSDTFAKSVLLDVVGGDAGVVAVSYSGVIAHSSDGQAWEVAGGLPAEHEAVELREVAAYPGGFVIVGRDGERDPVSQASEGPLPPGTGRPAAWISSDGVHWAEADVEGSEVAGGELKEVAVGADGMFATGIANAVDTQFADPTTCWASADGQNWRQVAQLGTELPAVANGLPAVHQLVGDGTLIAIMGRESAESNAMTVSVSTDGTAWTRLTFTGEPTDLRVGIWDEGAPQGAGYVVDASVQQHGLLIRGWDGVSQRFWFATAVVP